MVREQTLKHRDCQNPVYYCMRVKPVASPCSNPSATDSPGGAAGGVGWTEIKILWALGVMGTVGSWLAASGSALGWRLGSVGTPDAAAWVGDSAWSRPWLYLPSPASLCQVTSLALPPSMIF